MKPYSSKSARERMLNSLLIKIVIAANGQVKSQDKNALLQSWLDALRS